MTQAGQDVVAPPDGPDAARCASLGEVPIPAAIACLSCLAGGWIAAGSAGMLDDALRHALMWAAFALAVFADRVFRPRRALAGFTLIVGGAAVVAMGASGLAEMNVLAGALLAALLAASRNAPARRALATVAQALVVLALWRLLVASVPALWIAADHLGWVLGLAGSAAADHPLWTGATFGGVDFLITMLALLAGYLPAMRRRRLSRGLLIFFAIAAGHMLYLVVLAFCPRIVSALPDTSRAGWDWASAVRSMAPWNVPALAAAIDLAIAAAMIRWSTWPNEITPHGVTTNGTTPDGVTTNGPGRLRLAGLAAAIVVAAGLPFVATFSPGPCSLGGKKVVVLAAGAPAANQPASQPSHQPFAMLGELVRSLGGRLVVAADLSQEELSDANVVVVLAPDRPWGQGQLAMIDKFVRSGGSLLVAGARDPGDNGPCDELLALAGMSIRPGKAWPAVEGRFPFIEPFSHPATGGIGGIDYIECYASLEIGFGARPILTERWAWADADDAVGEPPNGSHDAGEKLGDLAIAAERKLDNGTVVALADTSALTDPTLVRSGEFTIRLLGYLASRPAGPGSIWRQVVSLAAGALLVILLLGRAGALRPAAVAIVLAGALWISTQATASRCQPGPDSAGLPTSMMTHGKSTMLYSCEDGRLGSRFNAAPTGPGNIATGGAKSLGDAAQPVEEGSFLILFAPDGAKELLRPLWGGDVKTRSSTGFAALHPWLQACAPTGLKATCSLSMYSGLPEAPVAELRNRPARLPQTAVRARRSWGASLAVLRPGEARP